MTLILLHGFNYCHTCPDLVYFERCKCQKSPKFPPLVPPALANIRVFGGEAPPKHAIPERMIFC